MCNTHLSSWLSLFNGNYYTRAPFQVQVFFVVVSAQFSLRLAHVWKTNTKWVQMGPDVLSWGVRNILRSVKCSASSNQQWLNTALYSQYCPHIKCRSLHGFVIGAACDWCYYFYFIYIIADIFRISVVGICHSDSPALEKTRTPRLACLGKHLRANDTFNYTLFYYVIKEGALQRFNPVVIPNLEFSGTEGLSQSPSAN